MNGLELYQKGGVMMIAITMLSVYVLGVIFFKIWQFFLNKPANFEPSQIIDDVRNNKREEAAAALEKLNSPVANVMRAVVICLGDEGLNEKQRESEIQRIGTAEISRLESHMRGLELSSGIAPLLGLLGTVIGLIDSFSKLGTAGTRVDPSMLAGGIWEALLATAGGLAVAIIALGAHHIFDTSIERTRTSMQDAVARLLNIPATKKAPEVEERADLKLMPKYLHT